MGPQDEPAEVIWAEPLAPERQEMVLATTASGPLPEVTANHPVQMADGTPRFAHELGKGDKVHAYHSLSGIRVKSHPETILKTADRQRLCSTMQLTFKNDATVFCAATPVWYEMKGTEPEPYYMREGMKPKEEMKQEDEEEGGIQGDDSTP